MQPGHQPASMSALGMALALAWAVMAIGSEGAYRQASLPAFQFEVGSVTDNCDCLKVVITSLYRAQETLANIESYAGAHLDQREPALEAMPVLSRPTSIASAADQLQDSTHMYAGQHCAMQTPAT